MHFELDNSPPDMAAPDLSLVKVVSPDSGVGSLINQDDAKKFIAARDGFVSKYDGFVVNSPEDLEEAGRVIDTCISMKKGIEGAFKKATDYFFSIHRALTGERAALAKPFDDLEKTLRSQTVSYRQRVAEEERQARLKAEAEARARAEAEAESARRAAQEAADRAAAEAKAAEAAAAAAAADTDDIDAIMAAEAAAEAAAREAAAAVEAAAAIREEPVYVPPVAAPVASLDKHAGGSTLVDKWVPEYEDDEAAAVRAIVAALPQRPDLIGLLSINEGALKDMAKALKGEARIPGIVVKNKPIDKRVSARRKA